MAGSSRRLLKRRVVDHPRVDGRVSLCQPPLELQRVVAQRRRPAVGVEDRRVELAVELGDGAPPTFLDGVVQRRQTHPLRARDRLPRGDEPGCDIADPCALPHLER
jgi:hypothetical protein